jgi:hypothetical protein
MLERPDAEVIRDWLNGALSATPGDGKPRPGDLAALCNVTPQAVNGWARTGRMKKAHVAAVAQYLGHGPRFTTGAPYAAADSAGHRWPFTKVSAPRFHALPQDQKDQIDTYAAYIVHEWERQQRGAGNG